MVKIIALEGVGEVFSEKLIAAGIKTVEALLTAGAMPKGREELAAKTGISADKILSWVNFADLYRIKGVGEEYSQLLEKVGVDTVPELARRSPENLYAKIMEINAAEELVRQAPSLGMVQKWVEQAKSLPRIIEY